MDIVIISISWVCLLLGSFFCLSGGIGILRFPDFYTRMHASGVTDTLGASLIFLGLMLQAGWNLVMVKLIFITLFILLTSPTSNHALAKAAVHGKLKPKLFENHENNQGAAS